MSSTRMNPNPVKQSLPTYLQKSMPQNLQKCLPFIKMKRLPEIDDSLLILTEYMSLNISFTSPLLQAIDFLQQYHKYSLRAILSSFPIPNQSFDTFYNEIQNMIMLKYKKNVTRLTKMVYEMINVANCQKINEMKMYEQIFLQIKNELLLGRKQTDPYGFNSAQFLTHKQDVKKILEFCQNYLNINNIAQTQAEKKEKIRKQNQTFRVQAKTQIQKMTQSIKNKTISMMDKMNDAKVDYPYRPQNQAYDIIETQKILHSFYTKIKIKNIQTHEDLERKRYNIEKQLRKILEEGLKQYKEDTSYFAKSLINQYNKQCKSSKNERHHLTNSICSPMLNIEKRRGIDANDINMNFTDTTQLRPAIKNIRKQIKFDKIVKFHDLDVKTEEIIEVQASSLPYGKVKNKSCTEGLNNMDMDFEIKANPSCFIQGHTKNLLQKLFYQPHYKRVEDNKSQDFQKKQKHSLEQEIKTLELEFGEYKKSRQERERVNLSKQPRLHFNKNIYIQKNFIVECLFDQYEQNNVKANKISQKELILKQNVSNPFQKKKNPTLFTTQQNHKHIEIPSSHRYIVFKTKQQKCDFFNDFSHLSSDQIQRIQIQNNAFQTQRKIDISRKLQAIKGLAQIKTYQKFCALTINPKTKKGGLDIKTYIESNKIYRYGIQMDLSWQVLTGQIKNHLQIQKLSQNRLENLKACKLGPADMERLNKFFFYVFKEKYYRETKIVEENSEIPLLMTLESQADFLNEKMVKKIISLIKKFDFFILWTLGDIMAYEEKVEFGQRKGKLTIYMFAENEKLGTGLIWEIRKRISESFKQENLQNVKGIDHQLKMNRKVSLYVLEEGIEHPFHDKKSFEENKETVNEVLCRIECVHRFLYARHKRPLTVEKTIEKGGQLWEELLKWS